MGKRIEISIDVSGVSDCAGAFMCSPGMSPCDCPVFGRMKKHLKGKGLQLERRTQGRCEGLSLISVAGILEQGFFRWLIQWVLLRNSTDKFRGIKEGSMAMTNQHGAWGRKTRLVSENRDNNSRREKDEEDEGIG
ncbi:hypothetical protein TNCV_899181 [Trichonephila clavipes]|nr:hypothetical protein TNCV_899181 [Trichonephila clavipes]